MKSSYIICCALIFSVALSVTAQTESSSALPPKTTVAKALEKLSFKGDFRSRVEQDWWSRRPDGTYRDDRTRFRVRLRLGLQYSIDEHMQVKARIRTGYAGNPQDPQITIGSGEVAYDNFPIMLDQAVFKYERGPYWIWTGRDDFPFTKYSEVFWSDNVTPTGIAAGLKLFKDKKTNLDFNAGYFIGLTSGTSLDQDAYLLSGQLVFRKEREKCALEIPVALHAFQNFPLYPGKDSEQLDRAILQPSVSWRSKKVPIKIAVEAYFNLLQPDVQDSLLSTLEDQTNGWNVVLAYGKLKEKGDYQIKLTYAMVQQFSIVDYFAQNDWARWSYGNVGSPAGRLSNFQGMEVAVGWKWHKNARLVMKYYPVEQLERYGPYLETNQRIRLDLDVSIGK